MPYITEERRIALDLDIALPTNAGELNYKITLLLIEYWEGKDPSYQSINDVVGACEGAKAEFQRRVVVPYEDSKIQANGDVYVY